MICEAQVLQMQMLFHCELLSFVEKRELQDALSGINSLLIKPQVKMSPFKQAMINLVVCRSYSVCADLHKYHLRLRSCDGTILMHFLRFVETNRFRSLLLRRSEMDRFGHLVPGTKTPVRLDELHSSSSQCFFECTEVYRGS